MNVQHKTSDTKGSFFIEENGEKMAEMTYSKWGNTKFIIDHTEVSGKLRGKGAGKQLVFAAVEFARDRNMKILPICPYAKSIFDKMDEIRDVLV